MAAQPTTELALTSKNIVNVTAGKIREFTEGGALRLPANYSPENALKSAYLAIQANPDLQKCDLNSTANALLDMVVQGLTPSKKQVYLIPYGGKMVCQRSYFGDMALAQRAMPGIDFQYNVVYADDKFSYSVLPGQKGVTAHEQTLGSVDSKKIIGAYCQVVDADGAVVAFEVMSMEQILQSWGQSKTFKLNDPNCTHNKFKSEMCLRTVVRKACKPIINSSDDAMLMGAIKRQDELAVEAEVDAEAAEFGNGEILTIEASEVSESVPVHVETVDPAPPQEEDKTKGKPAKEQASLVEEDPGY